jgi:hypothetical protein
MSAAAPDEKVQTLFQGVENALDLHFLIFIWQKKGGNIWI